jgi:hypothetical protein
MAHRTEMAWPQVLFALLLWAVKRAMLSALALGPLAAAAHADAVRQAPNSRIAMEVPRSFTGSTRFSGFVDEGSGASFLIIEMPAVAWNELRTLADKKEALEQKGVIETRTAALAGRNGEYVYIIGKQKTQAGDYGKHILVMRENGVTAMITANLPPQALESGKVTVAQVERAFVTATVRDEAAKGRDLFTLSYLGPFKESLSILGSSKAYSPSGKVPEPGSESAGKEPVFVVAPSVDKAQLGDVKVAAQSFFRKFAGMTEQQVKSEKPVTIAGLKGYEIVGEGTNGKDGSQSGVYVVLLSVEQGGYYVMAGSAPTSDMATHLPEFQKIVLGFQPKPAD